MNNETVKVLVTGSANGKLTELFSGVAKFNEKWGPFDLLLCVGDLFGENTGEINCLLSDEIKIPITTCFMHGKYELPDIVKERVENNNGEFCQNLLYLGNQGSITTTHGIKIAFVSGILNSSIDKIPTQVDILLTYEWPKDITRLSSQEIRDVSGSNEVAQLAAKFKPRYHFATSENVFFKREPYQNTPSNFTAEDDDTKLNIGIPTWFVGLAEVGNPNKEKWYYGFNLVPLMRMPQSAPLSYPKDMTECPFNIQGQKRKLDDTQKDNYFWSTGDSSESTAKRGRLDGSTPPDNYICNKCNLPGHWIRNCPQGNNNNQKRRQNMKPQIAKEYVCKSCQEVGTHLIFDCPNYECRRCGGKGHPPKDCPSSSPSTSPKRKNKTPAQPCWFCLSNPKTVKHLIVSIGNELYLSLAKGSLIDTQDPSKSIIPGGGHILLIAIMHYPTFREAPLDDQINMKAEMEKYKSSLKRFFQDYGAGMVTFEVSFFRRTQHHYHIQIVPIPFEHDSEKIRDTFLKEAETDELKFHKIQGSSIILPVNYFKVDLPDGTSLIHEVAMNEHFDVQYGRKVLSKLLGSPQRVNWRDCVISDELERADAEKFKKAFSKYDPMADTGYVTLESENGRNTLFGYMKKEPIPALIFYILNMSDGRHSTSESLQPSVDTTAEELSENYQKLFSEFSRPALCLEASNPQGLIAAQEICLQQKNQINVSLRDECKAREQELRTSLQQLDLLTFHNQRLTKRIENLQESSAAKSSPGWLVGSAKKELEKTKILLEAANVDLTKEIENNEILHEELYEAKSLYTQRSNALESKISGLKKKVEELKIELTRSQLASEDALNTLHYEKRELDNELKQARSELSIKKALLEKNDHKLKGEDDTFRAEMIVLRDTLSINLENSFEPQIDKFNELNDKIDNKSNEIIASFRQLQLNARNYLKSLEGKSELSCELGLKVKNASKAWQQNLQTLIVKLASIQGCISELTAEKEKLVKANEYSSNRVVALETEITRLKEELNRQKELAKSGNDYVENCAASQQVNVEEEDDDDEEQFIYPVDTGKQENLESSNKSIENASHLIGLTIMTAETTKSVTDADINTSREGNLGIGNEDDALRETLVKKHYESKISQLTEHLQIADKKSVQLHTTLKVLQEKLVDSENLKLRSEQENLKFQDEISKMKEELAEVRVNNDKQVKEMTGWIEQGKNTLKELDDKLAEYEAGTSRNE
ncbi:4707_t:CDS:10 [Scutellospora calospora]|uniref:4707_t:CDS:1 n=1 Tax=Scutellospora calospora TaxID=85575 RepID=A0ACA9KP96_9GLOM|nr:4707_t:CDS:10 [Scutellospora calospora]